MCDEITLRMYKELQSRHPALFNNTNSAFPIITDEAQITAWQKQRQATLLQSGKNLAWSQIGVVFDDPFIVILRDLVEFPGGTLGGYIRIYNRAYLEKGAAGVAVLPEYKGRLILVEHYRHATRSYHWEIPRGFGEAGRNAVKQAMREVYEELGGVTNELIDLGILYNNTGLEGNPVSLFLARLKSFDRPQVEEGIERFALLSLEEVERMIAQGEVTDSFTIVAYTRAKLRELI